MPDEVAQSNPNQGFDNYAKEFQLRIELLRAAGEYAKAQAEAMKTTAQALDQVERTKTTAAINRSLRFALSRLEQHQRRYELDIKVTARHAADLGRFIVGNKPADPTMLNNRVASIGWFLEHGGDTTVLAEPIPTEARVVEAWATISVTHGPEELPTDVVNVAGLIPYMRARLAYPVVGGYAHLWLVGTLTRLAAGKAAIIAQLEATLAAARVGQYEALHEYLPYLKISKE